MTSETEDIWNYFPFSRLMTSSWDLNSLLIGC